MRLTDVQRRAYAVRERVEAEMQQAVNADLQWLYRHLLMKVRRINQFRPRVQSTAPKLRKSYVVSGDLWEEFRRRMHSSIMRAIVFGALELYNIDRLLYSTVVPVEFNSEDFAKAIEPEIGERIVQVETAIKREVGRKVVGWYNSPGTTMQSLINQLKESVFTESRARMIAQTEVTHLNSRVHENIALKIGATEWWWSTRNDQLVCKRPLPGPDGRGYKGCRELHGKVFKIGDLMPPYASHPNCRCSPIIITPKKQVEEPAKLIEELLAVRKGIHDGATLALELFKSDFKESEHPRADDGKWTSGAGGGGKTKQQPKPKWGSKGIVTPRVPPARPADISDNDKRLLREYVKHYKIPKEDMLNVYARTQNTPKGTYYHLSREGIKSTAPTSLMNNIGSALYVGRDPVALKEFYGELQGVDDGEVFEFKADDLNILDMREIADKDRIESAAKKEFPDEKFPVGVYARAHGYDALVYFDPLATGEEFAIFNNDKVTQTGRVSDSAKPEQKPQPAAKPTKSYLRKPKTASEISGRVPKRDGRPVPETTKRVFHVTKRENVEAILRDGFDLSRVKPRWGNDYAISTTNAPLPKAMEYFMPYSKGAQFDNEQYAVLQVTVKGRFYDYDTDRVDYRNQGLSAQGWTRAAVRDGWDGQAGANMYIYNPEAIMEIKEVDPADIGAANEKLKRRVLKYASLQELRKADWEEQKHPRRRDGKFAPKGQGEAGGGKPTKTSQHLAAPLRMLAPDPDIDDLPEVKQWRQKHYQNSVHRVFDFGMKAGIDPVKFNDILNKYGENIANLMPPQKAYKEFLKSAHKVMDGKVDEKDLLRLENAIRVADWRYIKEFKPDGGGQPPQPPQPPKPEVKPPQPKPEPEAVKPPTAGSRKMGAQVAKELMSVVKQIDADWRGHYDHAGVKYPQAAAKYDTAITEADDFFWKHVDPHPKGSRTRKEHEEIYNVMKARAEKEWEAEKLRPPEALRPYLEVEKGKEVGYIKKDKKALPDVLNVKVDDAFIMLQHIFSDNVSLVHKRVSLRYEAGVRAYCDNFMITLDKHDSPKTIVHEYGHYIEANNKYARREVKKFLRRRTKGEVAKKLNVLTDKNYGDHEEAKPDKFFNPYCGKVYKGGYTEILSMGLQEYATDPVKFLKTDPEYFALIYDVLHGNFEPEPAEVKKLHEMADLMKASWEEQKHPRKNDGKFAPKGQGESGGGKPAPSSKEERMAAPPNPAIDNLPEVRKWRRQYFYGAGGDLMGLALNSGLDSDKFTNALIDYANDTKGDGDPAAAWKKMRSAMLAEMKGKVDPAALTRLDNAIRVGEWRYLKNLKLPPQPVKVKPPPDNKPEPDKPKPGGKRGDDVAGELAKMHDAKPDSKEYKEALDLQRESKSKLDEINALHPGMHWLEWKQQPEYEEREKRESAYYAACDQLNKERRKSDREREKKARAILLTDKPSRVSPHTSLMTERAEKHVKAGVKLFNEFVSSQVSPTDRLNIHEQYKVRANYDHSRAVIQIEKSDSPAVVVHEMGHWLENNNSSVKRMVKDFFKRRTAGETIVPLNEVAYKGYDDHEVAKPDKFFNPYCGKVYKSGDTEILSMGLQEYTTNPMRFAKKDPEYFALIYNICHGIYDDDLGKLTKTDSDYGLITNRGIVKEEEKDANQN